MTSFCFRACLFMRLWLAGSLLLLPGFSPAAATRLLTVTPLVGESRLRLHGLGLQSFRLPRALDTGSVAVAHGLGCPVARGPSWTRDRSCNCCTEPPGSPNFTLLQAAARFSRRRLLKRLPLPHRVLLPPCRPSAPESAPFFSSSAHRFLDKEAEPHLPLAPTNPRPA